MVMKWYYSHDGRTQGPFSTAELKERAAAGSLHPDDPLWPEGADPRGAVAVSAVLDWADLAPAPPALPDWLEDVREADRLGPEPRPAEGAPLPDWLADIQQAEGDVAPPPAPGKEAEEMAAELLLSEPPDGAEAEPGPAPPRHPAAAAERGPALQTGGQGPGGAARQGAPGPAAPPTEPFDVALRRAMKEVHHLVDLDENRPLVLRGDVEAIRWDTPIREVFERYQGYGPEMATKLQHYLEFLTDNRRRQGGGSRR